jgi:hypothetical protein
MLYVTVRFGKGVTEGYLGPFQDQRGTFMASGTGEPGGA